MAKKHNLLPGWLFAISAIILSGGWLMKSFPVLIFAGLAPLFAIMDHVRDDDRFWSLIELILAALAIGLFAAHTFEMKYLAFSLVQAILLSLAFVGASFVQQRLGSWSGKLAAIIFWVAIEYVFTKLPWHNSFILLGDALTLKAGWLDWTQYSGYLGTSLWILTANLFLYHAFFRNENIRWKPALLTVLWIVIPMIYSYWKDEQPITRNDMYALPVDKNISIGENFIRAREVIPVAATGLSVLILLVALTRNKIHK